MRDGSVCVSHHKRELLLPSVLYSPLTARQTVARRARKAITNTLNASLWLLVQNFTVTVQAKIGITDAVVEFLHSAAF